VSENRAWQWARQYEVAADEADKKRLERPTYDEVGPDCTWVFSVEDANTLRITRHDPIHVSDDAQLRLAGESITIRVDFLASAWVWISETFGGIEAQKR